MQNISTRLISVLLITSVFILVATLGAGCSVSEESTESNSLAVSVPNVVLLAEKSIALGASDSVTGGDVVVRQLLSVDAGAGDSGPPGAQVIIGAQSRIGTTTTCAATNNVVAGSVYISTGACAGNLQSNAVSGTGRSGTVVPFPTSALAPLTFASSAPGATNVSVAPYSTVTLGAGSYGAVSLAPNAKILLTGGAYHFGNVVLSDGASIRNSAAATIDATALTTGVASVVAPVSPLTASSLTIGVTTSVQFGGTNTVQALIAVPHGSLNAASNSTLTGAFSAFTVQFGDGVVVVYQDGFASSPHGTQQLHGYSGVQPAGFYEVLFPVERGRPLTISIGLPVRSPAALASFIQAVSDPHNALYRQYLTPSSFSAQFGATTTDYNQVLDWAQSRGFAVNATYSNKLLLTITGTTEQIERALYVNLVYRAGGDFLPGFVSADREPSLDLSPSVLWVTGLTDSVTSRSTGCATPPSCNPNLPRSQGSVGGLLSATDVRQAYLGAGAGAATCLGLTGAGQTVGILSLEPTNPADLQGYAASQPTGSNLSFSGLRTIQTFGGAGFLMSPDGESALDPEAVMAMAPAANIKVFQGPTAITDHVDDLLHAMATDGSLTVATTSYLTGRSLNSEQALAQLAAQGTTFFQSSGDWGDEAGVQDSRAMPYQTIVGGTMLTVTAPTLVTGVSGASTLSYPTPYVTSEIEYNGQCPGVDIVACSDTQGNPYGFDGIRSPAQDITGGGIMDGHAYGGCRCFPEPLCCGASVPIPGYQGSLGNNGSGASNTFRNFPDIAANATNFSVFYNGPRAFGGTSLATPLMAGYVALVNQQASINQVGLLGFANPVLYAIGSTKGNSGAADLYTPNFSDTQDGAFNQVPFPNQLGLGHPTVPGYDLATGWGAPSCGLLQVLSSYSPTSPQIYGSVMVNVANGHDGVNDQSSVDLTILTTSGVVGPIAIKGQGVAGWDGVGVVHSTGSLPLPQSLRPQDVASVTLTLHQNGQGGISADNWDVAGIQVLFVGVGVPYACITDLSGNGSCDATQASCNGVVLSDSQTGVVRLSELPGNSGQGPSATFGISPATSGCASYNGAPSSEPYDQFSLVVDTGDDDLRSDSVLTASFRDNLNNQVAFATVHPKGSPSFDNNTEHSFLTPPLFKPRSRTEIASIRLSFQPGPGDEWHMQGIQIFGQRAIAGGQLGCLSYSPYFAFKGGAGDLVIPMGTGCL